MSGSPFLYLPETELMVLAPHGDRDQPNRVSLENAAGFEFGN